MKPEFRSYFLSIGMTEVLIARAASILGFYEGFLSVTMEAGFVSEYVKEDNTRAYENLWLFAGTRCYEAKAFVSEDDLDSVEIGRLGYWALQKKSFDLPAATHASRLTFRI